MTVSGATNRRHGYEDDAAKQPLPRNTEDVSSKGRGLVEVAADQPPPRGLDNVAGMGRRTKKQRPNTLR